MTDKCCRPNGESSRRNFELLVNERRARVELNRTEARVLFWALLRIRDCFSFQDESEFRILVKVVKG